MKARHPTAIVMATTAVIGVGIAAAGGSLADGWKSGHRGGEGPHGGAMMFERFDADADGRVTRTEADAFVQEQLASFDADGSGTLSLDEFEGAWSAMMRERMVRGFQRFDRDGDGQLSQDELNRPIDQAFALADRNDDDAIEASEVRRGGRHGERGRDHGDDN